MTLRRRLCVFLVGLALVGTGLVAPARFARAQDGGETYEFLFVQTGTSGSFDGKRLTLENVGPTILFTDRPQRITGHMSTDHFVRQWGQGSDNFAEDPPNAAFSVYSKDGVETSVVEISDPRVTGSTLSYQVKVLDGTVPARFTQSSLFIDILGRGVMFLGGAAIGRSASAAQSQQASQTTTEATHSYTTSPPATSPDCEAARQQMVAATTEDEIKLASQKVDVLCGQGQK